MMVSEALTKWKSLDRSIIAELCRLKDGRFGVVRQGQNKNIENNPMQSKNRRR
jgi:hypothetical protein